MNNYRYKRHLHSNQKTRWATPDEVKASATRIHLSDETCPASGLPLLSDGSEVYVDGTDTHTIIFGTTGSKKTRLFCMPMLGMFIKAGESFIASDPKGELYERSAGMAQANGYKVVVLNFRDVGSGDMWNPLSLPYDFYHSGKKDMAVSMLNDFVQMITEPHRKTTNDMFWPEMAASFALANLLLLMECADPSEANVTSLSRLCSPDAEDSLLEISEQMSVYSIARMNYRNVLTVPEKTRMTIFASLFAMVRIFTTQQDLAYMLSDTSFDISAIGREKTAVYVIVPDERTTLHSLVTIFIKQAYEILVTEAQKEPNGMLTRRVNFLLDEFCNIPRIPDIPSMISAARSRNMRFYLVIQSLHQLRGRYGEDADTIKGNCENWVFLTSKELDLLWEISKLCGSVVTADGRTRSLISVSELQRLDKNRGEALLLQRRLYPFISELPDIDAYTDFSGMSAPALKRSEKSDYRIFSLDTFYDDLLAGRKPMPFPKQEGE